jgi:formylglycine-generating enzyme required for sulfatase activity
MTVMLLGLAGVAAWGAAPGPLPEMVPLPAGRVMIGSSPFELERVSTEGPQHQVTVKAFQMSRYPITFAEWDQCLAEGGCNKYQPSDSGWGRGERPVINISWNDAQSYIAWLNAKVLGRPSTGSGDGPYRLPTEAEWEYAARAGTTTRYYWGNDIGMGHANCDGCSTQWDGDRTAPVSAFHPNPWNLYGMAGNVMQWTADCWSDDYTDAPKEGEKPSTAGNCSRHVVRGGSWRDNPASLRSAYRDWYGTGRRENYLGFRVASDLPDPRPQ